MFFAVSIRISRPPRGCAPGTCRTSGKYKETYGSLGVVIAFMTWLWLSATLVLIGAEINAEMEHQIARDSTEGAARPRGERGARMANEIGEAG
jgi:membrane protein